MIDNHLMAPDSIIGREDYKFTTSTCPPPIAEIFFSMIQLSTMGSRGEIYSRKQSTNYGQRTYFFNLKENRFSDIFVSIVESIKTPEVSDAYQRTQIVIFSADWSRFATEINLAKTQIQGKNFRWNSILETSSQKRSYSFEILEKARNIRLLIKEVKPHDEGPNDRLIRINIEDLDSFMASFSETIAHAKNDSPR
ncbi:MAG: DUF3276 family protein [Spirochaetia bacterium]